MSVVINVVTTQWRSLFNPLALDTPMTISKHLCHFGNNTALKSHNKQQVIKKDSSVTVFTLYCVISVGLYVILRDIGHCSKVLSHNSPLRHL